MNAFNNITCRKIAGISLAGLLPLLFFLASAHAQEPFKLESPLRCQQGNDCWIVNYVDTDSSPQVKDYMCGAASYDAHKGTDIAVRDANAMREGVEVFASAAGVVVGTRNNMRDIDFNLGGGPDSVKDKECGNGILLDHGNGWSTQYCHMLRASVTVGIGDQVTTGQTLGLVGMSGLTEFPHLHIQVRYKDAIIDPFVGLEREEECGIGKAPLWSANALLSMLYEPTAIYNAGFASTTPNARIAREGLYEGEVLFQKSPLIVLWADIFWINPGDKLKFSITGPNGEPLLTHTTTMTKKHARRFAYAGLNRPAQPWPKGAYSGEIRLIRPGSDDVYSALRIIDVN